MVFEGLRRFELDSLCRDCKSGENYTLPSVGSSTENIEIRWVAMESLFVQCSQCAQQLGFLANLNGSEVEQNEVIGDTADNGR
jgi:hypothetical protein